MRFRGRIVALAGLAIAVAIAGSLAFVRNGDAGSSGAKFGTYAEPTVLTASTATTASFGFAKGSFTPTGGGAATHVVMKLTLSKSAVTSVSNFSCPGTMEPVVDAGTSFIAECDISSVSSGVTARFFVQFQAVILASTDSPVNDTVGGDVTWDNGGGSNGTNNEIPSATSGPVDPLGTYTVYPAGDSSHAGACTTVGSSLPAIVESGTGKGAQKDTYAATSASGLPCTFAQVSIENTETQLPGLTSKGTWNIVSAPTSGLNSVVLTVNSVPGSWKSVVLKEIFGDGTTDPVPLCISTNGVLSLPTTKTKYGDLHQMCLNPNKPGPQGPFGQGGVMWVVAYAGTGVDPSSGY